MEADKEFFKNCTAETQSTQREEFLPNRETTIGQNLLALTEMNKSSISVNRRKSAVKYPLKDLTLVILRNRDMFLFVVVSRQTKKSGLCDLCASAVNKSLYVLFCVGLRLSEL